MRIMFLQHIRVVRTHSQRGNWAVLPDIIVFDKKFNVRTHVVAVKSNDEVLDGSYPVRESAVTVCGESPHLTNFPSNIVCWLHH